MQSAFPFSCMGLQPGSSIAVNIKSSRSLPHSLYAAATCDTLVAQSYTCRDSPYSWQLPHWVHGYAKTAATDWPRNQNATQPSSGSCVCMDNSPMAIAREAVNIAFLWSPELHFEEDCHIPSDKLEILLLAKWSVMSKVQHSVGLRLCSHKSSSKSKASSWIDAHQGKARHGNKIRSIWVYYIL